jgi:NADH-quinone oxidoreductase subunit A
MLNINGKWLNLMYFCLSISKVCSIFCKQMAPPATDITSAASYLPVALQFLFAAGMIGFLMVLTHLLGPKRKTADKLETFASGIENHGEARQPVAIKYFLVAILFVLFDVEVIFFYPYAVNFRDLGWNGFWAVLMFVGFFFCGFLYILKKGALTWED